MRCNRINGIQKILEKRHVFLLQHLEIIDVDVRREERVSDIFTKEFDLVYEVGHWGEEVQCDEFDTRILPIDGKRAPGCNYYFRPVGVLA